MKKAIVTTTINPPTKALLAFLAIAQREDWHMFVVGDMKTPHAAYEALEGEHLTYLTPDQQAEQWPELSELIGWNCIQRRNFGLIAAHAWGAEVIATVDDDNIPYSKWGYGLTVNKEVEISLYDTDQPVWDPLSATHPSIWHRGFPVQMLAGRQAIHKGRHKRKVLVQADLWDGDPDIDAVCRIAMAPVVTFNPSILPFGSTKLAPFNSQNTFLSREVLPTYFLFPHVGRMDDIWAAYVTQFKFPNSVVFSKASVFQERNEHNLVKDLQAEMLGYEHNAEFVVSPETWQKFLPLKALQAYELYKKCFTA